MYDLIVRGGTIVDGEGAPAFVGDVAVRDGIIVEVGRVDGVARQVIEAEGALVTPGWVDAHTHYDGQCTWDDRIEGSASNGVTTVVMGNCGVGFAPVKPGDTAALIDLMEGVEAIPGTALYEGMPWGEWESFPDYLAYLDRRSWSLDIGTQLGHGALRYYVMGERAIEDSDATAEELLRMSQLVEEAVRAGALGFSTSRIQLHRSRSGYCVPGTYAPETELRALAEALSTGGGAVLQAITASGAGEIPGLPPELASVPEELRMFGRVSREMNIPVNFTLLQVKDKPEGYREALKVTAEENSLGARLTPMCAARAVTILTSLSTYHAFALRPTYKRLAHLPLEQLVAELRRPEVKAAILSEPNVPLEPAGAQENTLTGVLEASMSLTYPLEAPLDFEPTTDQSFAARAARQGRETSEFFYDFLLQDEGHALGAYFGTNYAYGNLEACREMILDPNTVFGLSDAGAHIDLICDLSMPTFQLTHWVRDRHRGERLPIELVVKKGTSALAELYGLTDRGSLAVGKRADINVIDFDNLSNARPSLHRDLPAGGARFLQSAQGYVATFVRGTQVRAFDEDTGARPGRVARRST